MDDHVPFPVITPSDVSWAAAAMSLPLNAFGCGDEDPRFKVFRSMETLDVAACPGSGKTTLLVAKLAVLGKKWDSRSHGICVLSHTNAARREIEERLGNTPAGRRLLRYPHFVGTIHGFINEFLALPYLRSLGYPIKTIDTEVCQKKRWFLLPHNSRLGLEKNSYSPKVLTIQSPDFSVGDVRWGKGATLGRDTPTYVAIQQACKDSTLEGYFCYDEMLMWARCLIETAPRVVNMIRQRFPLLFLDETQDNSEQQSSILFRIFSNGTFPVVRQRFGDINQAIFDSGNDANLVTDLFPHSNKIDLPNSHRFGQRIADLADPLGLSPYNMRGHGPKSNLHSSAIADANTIFVFSEAGSHVLDAFASLLIETFSSQELCEGLFKAVGQIHADSEDDDEAHHPKSVCHYWNRYDPDFSHVERQPETFDEFMQIGLSRTEMTEAFWCVEGIARGILWLSRMVQGARNVPNRRRCHRHVTSLLLEKPAILERYRQLIMSVAVKREIVTPESWENHWKRTVKDVAETIAGSTINTEGSELFLTWGTSEVGATMAGGTLANCNNIYRYPEANPKVRIHAGSIHSVKGETHTATLVLETFYRKHNLNALLPWLTGTAAGGQSAGSDLQRYRLKLHYVAMTRPTHLLCLAMKRSSFEDAAGNLDAGLIAKVKNRGWRVKEL